jgi:hypothetical protein
MKALIPFDEYTAERFYIIHVMLREFLGLDCDIVSDNDISDYVIEVSPDTKLIIKDSFFSGFPAESSYLRKESIPQDVTYLRTDFFPDEDLVVMYGKNKLEIGEREIVCHADIFASSFFMLTRWEEYVSEIRDSHDRFPGEESLAYKKGFLLRPVVNEYTEFLWNMLQYLGCKQERKIRKYQLFPTHDVNVLHRWKNSYSLLRTVGKELLKKRKTKSAIRHVKNYLSIKRGTKKDPMDTFDYFMDCAERSSSKAYFFFISGGNTSYERNYSIQSSRMGRIMHNIHARGHGLGLHPSYNSYTSRNMLLYEKQILERMTLNKIVYSRQHFLRFELPFTWRKLDEIGIEVDSTMVYSSASGFRCGVCYEFPVFDVVLRKQLNLFEYPLLWTDSQVVGKTKEEITEELRILKTQVKKYNGSFIFLWHNSNVNIEDWENKKEILEKYLYE